MISKRRIAAILLLFVIALLGFWQVTDCIEIRSDLFAQADNGMLKEAPATDTSKIISAEEAHQICVDFFGERDGDIYGTDTEYEYTGYEYVYRYLGVAEYQCKEYYVFYMTWIITDENRREIRHSHIQDIFVSVTGDNIMVGFLSDDSIEILNQIDTKDRTLTEKRQEAIFA